MLSHTCIGIPYMSICIQDIPYAYVQIYINGAEPFDDINANTTYCLQKRFLLLIFPYFLPHVSQCSL